MKLEVGKFYKDESGQKIFCRSYYYDDGIYAYAFDKAGTSEVRFIGVNQPCLEQFKEWQEPEIPAPGYFRENPNAGFEPIVNLQKQIDELKKEVKTIQQLLQ